MRRITFNRVLLAAAALAAIAASGSVHAQAWPTKSVRLVLGAPPGTAPDAAARIVSERLSAIWGQSILIDNKPGVGGMLAMEAVKASTADGYTLMFANAGAVVVTPKFLKVAKYDPLTEFTSIAYVADSPMMIVAGTGVKEKNVADMMASAKAAPGKFAIGSTEQSTLPFLVGHSMSQVAGASFLHVPFNQPSQALQALVNGDVQFSIDGIAPLLPLVKSGRINAIAVTSDRPLPGLEGIPMVKDSLPGYVAVGWFALLGPRGMPTDLVARINRDLNQVLAQDEVVKKMRDISLFANPRSPAETAAFIKVEIDKWAAVLKTANVQAQ